GHEDFYAQRVKSYGIEDLVELRPSISYHDALAETLIADGLLIFQASNSNHQIPAKLYEYLRASRPILAITDPNGNTATVMRAAGIESIVRLDSVEEIKAGLMKFLEQIHQVEASIATDETIAKYSRKKGAQHLAEILDWLE